MTEKVAEEKMPVRELTEEEFRALPRVQRMEVCLAALMADLDDAFNQCRQAHQKSRVATERLQAKRKGVEIQARIRLIMAALHPEAMSEDDAQEETVH